MKYIIFVLSILLSSSFLWGSEEYNNIIKLRDEVSRSYYGGSLSDAKDDLVRYVDFLEGLSRQSASKLLSENYLDIDLEEDTALMRLFAISVRLGEDPVIALEYLDRAVNKKRSSGFFMRGLNQYEERIVQVNSWVFVGRASWPNWMNQGVLDRAMKVIRGADEVEKRVNP